jgi:ubiquinone/menaquinone biosynthesis C-methylase UbiE
VAGGRLDDDAQRAARTYGAAADHFVRPALGFWDRYGELTVARLSLAPGASVLDLCCGAGASAIPAAVAVGTGGSVIGVDVAAPLLTLARRRAASAGLGNIDFRQGDATSTGLPSGSFDAVVCVFGVFFVRDMAAFVAEMWRLVAPGGTLAITTWGPDLFEPASSLFWATVRDVRPALYKAFNPWDEIVTPDALVDLFARGGVRSATAKARTGSHDLEHPDRFWDVVLGTGYRATIDALATDEREVVRQTVLAGVRERAITRLRTDVVFGTATRPQTKEA